MTRRALILFCTDTESGHLDGPEYDNANYRDFLTSNLGGGWYDNEILSIKNPTALKVHNAVTQFLKGADYTFIIFSGHGYLNTADNNRQYLELLDKDISILGLRTKALRQTLIIDACRGYHTPKQAIIKGFSDTYENFEGTSSTRRIFETAIARAESGWTILFAASKSQTALDTGGGGAYLLSLLKFAEIWGDKDKKNNILPLNVTHKKAKEYLLRNFDTIQVPAMNTEKRLTHFPFAVKYSLIHG
jgi:hypothetical protein